MSKQTIQLEAGQFSKIPRQIAGSTLDLFLINEQPYITMRDACVIADVTASTLRHHLNNIYAELSSDSRRAIQLPPFYSTSYQLPVQFQRTSNQVGGGGGTQYLTVHHLSVFLKAARRLRNALRQAAILAEVDAVYFQYWK